MSNDRAERLIERILTNVEEKVDKLDSKVETGFKEIHTRQDTTNGQVQRNKQDIESLTKKTPSNKITDKVDNKVLWAIVIALILAVGGVVGTEVIDSIGELLK